MALLKDFCVSVDAAETLAKLGEAKTAVLFLRELLDDADEYNRWRAAFAPDASCRSEGRRCGTRRPAQRPGLAGSACAAGALAKLGETATALPVLVKLLKSQDASVRENAACELGNIGPAAKGGIGALADLLVDKDWEVRSAAARAMGQMGPDARAVAPALRRASERRALAGPQSGRRSPRDYPEG